MEATRGLIVVVVINEELRFAALQLVHWRAVIGSSRLNILPTLLAQLLQRFRALFDSDAVVVALRHDASHVIHCTSDDGLDALIYGHGIQRHAAPTTDADHANALT